MTASCQEAMVEAQASDRTAASVSGTSAVTIESLRARLLSERAASKEARQQAHNIAQKVSELQTRLDTEIEYRKKAEAAMYEVLEVLKMKGVAMEQIFANTHMESERSASEEAAPIIASKDGESDQSSGEEDPPALMKSMQKGSTEPQGSVDDVVGTMLQHQEGSISEDSFSDKTQITLEDISGSDTIESEQAVVNKEGERSSHGQVVIIDPSKAHLDNSFSSLERVDEGAIEQVSESLRDSLEHAEREINIQTRGEPGRIFAIDSSCLPSANQFNVHQEEGLVVISNEQLSGRRQVDVHANGAPYLSNAKKLNDMAMPVSETLPSLGANHVHPYFMNSGYSHDMPHIYVDSVQNASSAEAPVSRGLPNVSNGTYQGQEHLSSRVAQPSIPQAPISDAILSLVDDKNGKLASILTALQLAKRQLKDEEQTSSYMEEKFETALPIPFGRNPCPGFYDTVPYQPPYRPRKPESNNASPIIHFPMSPTSDHEVSPFSPFDRHDGLRRSSSTSAYYIPSYEPYFQPKGELHLGNGITLYTD